MSVNNYMLNKHNYKINVFYNTNEMHDKLNYYLHFAFYDDRVIISFDESGGVVSIAICKIKYEDHEELLAILYWTSVYATTEEDGKVSEKRISDICDNLTCKLLTN